MYVLSRLSALKEIVSPSTDILSDPDSVIFRELNKCWSDGNLNILAAIIAPSCESDVHACVQWAVKASIPFVTRGGGHSEWSTIGEEGVITDLSGYCRIVVDEEARTATVEGGVLSKEVAVRLAEVGLCTGMPELSRD